MRAPDKMIPCGARATLLKNRGFMIVDFMKNRKYGYGSNQASFPGVGGLFVRE